MPFGPNLGMSELIVIFMILVLVFGASRLPQLGEGLGKSIRSFKRGISSDDRIETSEPAAPKAAVPKAEAEAPADAEVVKKS